MTPIIINQPSLEKSVEQLVSELDVLVKKFCADAIVSNEYICSILNTHLIYDESTSGGKYFKAGYIDGVKLILDSSQSWADNRVYLKKKKCIVESIIIFDVNGQLAR